MNIFNAPQAQIKVQISSSDVISYKLKAFYGQVHYSQFTCNLDKVDVI